MLLREYQFLPMTQLGITQEAPITHALPHTHTSTNAQLHGICDKLRQLPTHIHPHSLHTDPLKYSCWEARSVVPLLLSCSDHPLVKNLQFSHVLSATWTRAKLQKPLAAGAPTVPYRKFVSADQHRFLYIPSSEPGATSHFFGSLESMC